MGWQPTCQNKSGFAAELYWGKMTELVVRACKRNKTPTVTHRGKAFPLNWHLLFPPDVRSLSGKQRNAVSANVVASWRNEFPFWDLSDFSREVDKKINTPSWVGDSQQILQSLTSRVKAHSSRPLPKLDARPFSDLDLIWVLQNKQ